MTASPLPTHLPRTMQFLHLRYQQIPTNAANDHLDFPFYEWGNNVPLLYLASSNNVSLFYLASAMLSPLLILLLPLSPQLSLPALLLSRLQSSPTSCKHRILRVTQRCIGQLSIIDEKPFRHLLDSFPNFHLFALPTCVSLAWQLATTHCLRS